MADKPKWMQGAVKPENKGALHKELGVPEGKSIPVATLLAAGRKAKKDGDAKLERRVNFAKTAGGIAKGKK